MLRPLIIGIALIVVTASSAQAQSLTRDDATLRRQVSTAFASTVQSSAPAPAVQAGRTVRLTPSATSTLRPRADARARTASPAQSSGKKSFFKTPWPYVIIAAVVVVVVAVAASGGSGGGY